VRETPLNKTKQLKDKQMTAKLLFSLSSFPQDDLLQSEKGSVILHFLFFVSFWIACGEDNGCHIST
jgi:hypothetical protein